ncbi:MAG: AMP-binding protein [Rubrivivax sp.]|nr:AMP-binding protein [Rubrivivax sp.]
MGRPIGAVQRGLADAGLARGDHLLVVLQNRWEMATRRACQFAGVVMVPLNWRAKTEEIDYCLADAEAKAMVWGAASGGRGSRALGGARGAAHRRERGAWRDAAFRGLDGRADEPDAAGRGAGLVADAHTTGTTGKPKGVPRRQRAERTAALAHVAQNLYAVGERTLGVMPLYHTMGVRSLLAMALIDGRIVCIPRFDAWGAVAAIRDEHLTLSTWCPLSTTTC